MASGTFALGTAIRFGYASLRQWRKFGQGILKRRNRGVECGTGQISIGGGKACCTQATAVQVVQAQAHRVRLLWLPFGCCTQCAENEFERQG